MGKSLEEKARDKKPLVRSSVATDENAPLKLLELLANDEDEMVRGDVATNESASEDILRKLSNDAVDSVRCAVASNNSTPLDILAVLLTDTSKYVKQNAKFNPNAKKIGNDKKSSSNTSLKVVVPSKKSNPKAKPVDSEFSSQEVTASLFSYTPADFKKIKLKTELKNWRDDLDSNSSSYPLYVGSPFDEGNLNLQTIYDNSEFDEGLIYVIPHYFYQSATYAIDTEIDSSWAILLAPILGKLLSSKPMEFAQKDDEQIWFEGQDSSDGTEPEVAVYIGSKLIISCPMDEIDDNFLKEVYSLM